MALMKYREANQVKWVGVRPAHRGEQIAKYATANNATVILHTVTAGKTFYLSFYTFLGYIAGAGAGVSLIVRNAADVEQYKISVLRGAVVGQLSQALALDFPLEIPAAYDVCAVSDSANSTLYAFAHGWEE